MGLRHRRCLDSCIRLLPNAEHQIPTQRTFVKQQGARPGSNLDQSDWAGSGRPAIPPRRSLKVEDTANAELRCCEGAASVFCFEVEVIAFVTRRSLALLAMTQSVLRGLPASPGKCVGRASVVSRLTALPTESIDVLVVKTASVEWLEAIVKARAVVTEIGGITSHAATICRELGKPCVTGVENIMSQLTSGALVTVDGTTGEVTILR